MNWFYMLNCKDLLLISLLVLLSSQTYSNGNNKNMLMGTWTCTNYSLYEDYRLLEIYNLKFTDNMAYQNGVLHFSNLDDDAILKYSAKSNFVLKRNILEFPNYVILDHVIDNTNFDQKYKILETFTDIAQNDIDKYQIEVLTNEELIYRNELNDFEEMSVVSKCSKVINEADLPNF